MTAFEPGSSGIRNDHAVNCATTTAQFPFILNVRSKFKDLLLSHKSLLAIEEAFNKLTFLHGFVFTSTLPPLVPN